jgi:hypothetical protein
MEGLLDQLELEAQEGDDCNPEFEEDEEAQEGHPEDEGQEDPAGPLPGQDFC